MPRADCDIPAAFPVHLQRIIIMISSQIPNPDNQSNPPKATLDRSTPPRRQRDIRSASKPIAPIYPEIADGYQGSLQSDFYRIDTVEIACYCLHQHLPNSQLLDHLFAIASRQYPLWTQLEVLKFLLGRLEVAHRSKPDWTDQTLYETVLTQIAN
jgi:hypothetical protein